MKFPCAAPRPVEIDPARTLGASKTFPAAFASELSKPGKRYIILKKKKNYIILMH